MCVGIWVCVSVCLCALNLSSSILGGIGILRTVGPPGRHYRPPTNPHGLQMPIKGEIECHLLLQASYPPPRARLSPTVTA